MALLLLRSAPAVVRNVGSMIKSVSCVAVHDGFPMMDASIGQCGFCCTCHTDQRRQFVAVSRQCRAGPVVTGQRYDEGEDPRDDAAYERSEEDGDRHEDEEIPLGPLTSDSIGSDLWPWQSPLEEALGDRVAGRAWPFLPHLDSTRLQAHLMPDVDTAPLDLAVLANSAVKFPQGSSELRLALERLQNVEVEATIPSMPPGHLSALVSSLGELQESPAECITLRRRALEELLKRRPLRSRHAACLLASLGASGDDGRPLVPWVRVLDVSMEVLIKNARLRQHLAAADAVAALEGLTRLRRLPSLVGVTRPESEKEVRIAGLLLDELQGGAGLARLTLLIREDCTLATRALAALLVLPEVLENRADLSIWLSSLSSLYWSRRTHRGGKLPQNLSEFQVAASACTLAACGAWVPARCAYLLAQAMHRDARAKKLEGGGLDPEAGAIWLHAIATAELSLETATEHVAVEDVLLGCAESLALADAGPETIARAIYALQKLGKLDERGLGEALLARLAELDARMFSSPTWLLLCEVRTSFLGGGGELPDVFQTPAWLDSMGEIQTQSSEEKPENPE